MANNSSAVRSMPNCRHLLVCISVRLISVFLLTTCDPATKTPADELAPLKETAVSKPPAPLPPPDAAPSPAVPAPPNLVVTPSSPDSAAAPTSVPTPTPNGLTVFPDCVPIVSFPGDEPVFLPKTKVMLTRITAPCQTPDGVRGHRASGGWMVMGFPCTGAEGRIDWKGTNYLAPKMVSFLLDTSCPMAPVSQSQLKQAVIEEAHLPQSMELIAFNPLVLQYWEVSGYNDADTTFSVDLRDNRSLKEGWTQFLKQKPFKVLLVGRENAWVPGNHMYAVEAEIHQASKNRFTLTVQSARVLKGDDLNTVKSRCEALKPERECGKVF